MLQVTVLIYLLVISMIIAKSSGEEILTNGYSCVYIISNNTASDHKHSNKIQWLVGNNVDQIISAVSKSRRC